MSAYLNAKRNGEEVRKLAESMKDIARKAIREGTKLHGEELDAALSSLTLEVFLPLVEKTLSLKE